MMMNTRLIIHTDGGARGNPGPAAVGVVIEEAGDGKQGPVKVVAEFGRKIGEATNNTAEYTAVIEALQYLRGRNLSNGTSVQFYLDSTLVVHQLNGLYKVKESHLRELLTRVRILESEVGGVIQYSAVPREQNWKADLLVNQALDQ